MKGWTCKISGTTTSKGSCGLPYYNAFLQVVGIHSASTTDGTVKVISEVAPFVKSEKEKDSFAWKGLTVSRSFDVGGSPVGTRYHRSVAHRIPYEGERYEPAPFGRGDARYTFSTVQMIVNGLEPYQQTPVRTIKPDLVSRAISHCRTVFNYAIGPHRSKNLTLEESIDCMDFSTSCGPYVPGIKKDYLDGDVVTGKLKERIETVWDKMSSGEPISQVYKLALKDELRPIDKNKAGKRRLLWGADAGLVVCANSALKGVSERLQSVVPLTPVGVGINMDSPIIDLVNSALVNKVVFNVDYSKWDSTMQPQVISAALSLLSDYCEQTPLTSAVISTLKSQAIGRYDDVSIQTKTGLASGMPFTSLINSVCHMILICCAILAAYEEARIPYEGCVFQHEYILTYGDDGVYGLTPMTASLFDSIVTHLKSFGLNPTGADKSSEIRPTVTPVFLKRTFAMTPHGLRALLDQDSLERQAYWIRGSLTTQIESPTKFDQVQRTAQLQAVLTHASQHGPQFYEKMAKIIEKNNQYEGLSVVVDYNCSVIEYNAWFNGSTPIGGEPSDSPIKLVYEMEGVADAAQAMDTTPSGVVTTTSPQNVIAQPTAPPPAASLVELNSATGAVETGVPLEVQNTFAVLTQVTWSTTQGPNTLLGTFQLSPNLNGFTSFLSKMWGAWTGDMFIRLTVSGSGMYSGRVMCAILPPGISPRGLANPGMFPHVTLDARSPDPAVFRVSDIRNTDYHYIDSNDPTVTFGLWVYNSLVNPFAVSGTTNAFITVESRPADNFAFAMLRPPGDSLNDLTTPASLLPPRMLRSRGVRGGGVVTGILAVGSVSLTNGHFDSSGNTFGWSWPSDRNFIVQTSGTNIQKVRQVVSVGDTLVSGIPNGWPDYCTSTVVTYESQISVGTLNGPICSDVHSNSGTGVIVPEDTMPVKVAVGTPGAGNIQNITLGSTLQSNNLLIVSTSSTNGVAGAAHNCTVAGVVGSTIVPPVGLQLPGTTRVVGALGGNNVAVWMEKLPNTVSADGYLCSSQLEHTASQFASGRINLPSGMMAVFNVTESGMSFQIGISSTGYLFLNAATGTSISLSSNTEFEFSGVYPTTTTLIGVPSSGGRPVV
nr:polyprotein [Bat sapovirus BtSY3]